MYPCFVASDIGTQKGVFCFIILSQTWLQMARLFRPVYRRFYGTAVVDDFIGRTAANLQLVCYCVDNHPSVEGCRFAVSFAVDGCPGLSLSLTLTSSATSEHAGPRIHVSLRKNTVIMLC